MFIDSSSVFSLRLLQVRWCAVGVSAAVLHVRACALATLASVLSSFVLLKENAGLARNAVTESFDLSCYKKAEL
jgi:hypothetical protein